MRHDRKYRRQRRVVRLWLPLVLVFGLQASITLQPRVAAAIVTCASPLVVTCMAVAGSASAFRMANRVADDGLGGSWRANLADATLTVAALGVNGVVSGATVKGGLYAGRAMSTAINVAASSTSDLASIAGDRKVDGGC
jgi:hypothetical protein